MGALGAKQAPAPRLLRLGTAVWYLRAPVLRALFQQLSDPGRLQPLGLVEVLDWTAAALDRVAFFDSFNEGEAVPYFYEPFLEAFDPTSASSWASGTPPSRWCGTWSPASTAP